MIVGEATATVEATPDECLEAHHLVAGVVLQPAAEERLGEPPPRPLELELLAVGDDGALGPDHAVERALEVEEPLRRAGDR